MAVYHKNLALRLTAGADLSTSEGCFVQVDGAAGSVTLTAASTTPDKAPMVLVCEKYRSRKRVDGIYRHVDDMSPAPHKPKRIEGESLFAANVRFRYLRDEWKDGVLYVYVEEI